MKFNPANKKNQLKVLHYISGNAFTGVDTFVLTLCENLKNYNIQSSITTSLGGRRELVRLAALLDIPLYPFSTADNVPSGMKRLFILALLLIQRIFFLVQLIHREDIDVIHLNATDLSGAPVMIAAFLARAPIVVIHHSSIYTNIHLIEKYRDWWRDVNLWLEKHIAARIMALYPKLADEFIERGVSRKQLAIVPLCVDHKKFAPIENDTEKDSLFRLVIVSRLSPNKGHNILLQAMAQLTGRYPQLRLMIIGDGPVRDELEEQIKELGLTDVVEMTGHVPYNQVSSVLHAARVKANVLPSYLHSESFPISLLEAMALGLPCIGTRWTGIPYIIVDGETGFIVEPKDVDSLANAIEKLVSNPEMAAEMGRKGHRRVVEKFSAEHVASEVAAIYAEVVHPAKGRQLKYTTK